MSKQLSDKIMQEIKASGVVPKPKWQFATKRNLLWALVAITVVLGALAVAVIIFIFVDHDANSRKYLDESVFEDLVQTIPFVWFGLLTLLVGLTHYLVRHTEFGYRDSVKQIVGLVLISSFVLGGLLSLFETGERVQDYLIERVPHYSDLVSDSMGIWSQPEKGLLGGKILGIRSSDEIQLTDFRHNVWLVDVGEVDNLDQIGLKRDVKIKIIGTQESDSEFRAVQLILWEK